jgi:hypothetical protein
LIAAHTAHEPRLLEYLIFDPTTTCAREPRNGVWRARFPWRASADKCSATSGLSLKAFFCSKAHPAARRERADHDGVGFTLTLEAALQIGLALFAPMLMPDPSAESEPRVL